MTPEEVITAGTLMTAKALNLDDDLGTIEAGKYADMLVLSADLRDDISVLTNDDTIDHLILGGHFVEDHLTKYR